MVHLTFSQIASFINGVLIGNDGVFTKIVIDSRKVEHNDFFVALKGEVHDAHNFIEQVIDKGASCLIVNKNIIKDENFITLRQKTNASFILVEDTQIALGKFALLYKLNFLPNIVAITGSSGKTTTRNIISCILAKIGKVLEPKKNFNNEIGLPLTLFELNKDYDFAVLEMGATKEGDIKYLMEIINPDVTLVTNIGPAHLSTMKSVDGVAKAKSEAYKYLSKDKIAVVNLDDEYSNFMLKILAKNKVITYSRSTLDNIKQNTRNKFDKQIMDKIASSVHVTVSNIEKASANCKFDLIFENMNNLTSIIIKSSTKNSRESLPKNVNDNNSKVKDKNIVLDQKINKITVLMNTVGYHNIMNALASSACALAMGATLSQIKEGIESFEPVARRLSVYSGIKGAKIIDDSYNANPASVKAAIDVLSDDSSKKKILIFADMLELGENAKQFHEEIGRSALSRGIDLLFTTGRMAKFSSIAFGCKAKHFDNKVNLVNELKEFLDSETTVLIKGSNGMKMDEVVSELIISE